MSPKPPVVHDFCRRRTRDAAPVERFERRALLLGCLALILILLMK